MTSTMFLKFEPTSEKTWNGKRVDPGVIDSGYVAVSAIAAYDPKNKIVVLTTGEKLFGSLRRIPALEPGVLAEIDNNNQINMNDYTVIAARDDYSVLTFSAQSDGVRVERHPVIAWTVNPLLEADPRPVWAGNDDMFTADKRSNKVYLVRPDKTVLEPGSHRQFTDARSAIENYCDEVLPTIGLHADHQRIIYGVGTTELFPTKQTKPAFRVNPFGDNKSGKREGKSVQTQLGTVSSISPVDRPRPSLIQPTL